MDFDPYSNNNVVAMMRKNPYEARTNDANDEGGEASSDDDKGSNNEDDNSDDNDSNGSEDSDGRDNSSDDSDSEGSDNSYDDVDYYNEDIKDDAEALGGDYEEYTYGQPSDWSCIIDANSKSGPRYDKFGKEIPELGSFHNSEFGLLTAYTDEEDDIDERLVTLDRNLMIHSF
ncbi:uncharacterized protein LOC111991072 [Quercus suber]|uniref:uncharacterized protein LOC111991072 n=1 Tax=Quercus suber TaxID=58331 RepID=UPI000CE1C045|nr:aspartate and serine-rich protein-like [Quercus suber]